MLHYSEDRWNVFPAGVVNSDFVSEPSISITYGVQPRKIENKKGRSVKSLIFFDGLLKATSTLFEKWF